MLTWHRGLSKCDVAGRLGRIVIEARIIERRGIMMLKIRPILEMSQKGTLKTVAQSHHSSTEQSVYVWPLHYCLVAWCLSICW